MFGWFQIRTGVLAHRSVPVLAYREYLISVCLAQLKDLENSVGSWDLYGQEDEKRYPSLQADFFERAAAPLERRESLIALIAVCTHPYPRSSMHYLC